MPRGSKAVAISLYFSLLTGILGRDGFAGDWHHRHSVCSSENCSLIRRESPAIRAFFRFPKIRMSSRAAGKPEFGPLFSSRRIGSPLFNPEKPQRNRMLSEAALRILWTGGRSCAPLGINVCIIYPSTDPDPWGASSRHRAIGRYKSIVSPSSALRKSWILVASPSAILQAIQCSPRGTI